MQDSDRGQPKRSSSQDNEEQHQEESELPEEEAPVQTGRRGEKRGSSSTGSQRIALPRKGFQYALSAGAVAGLLGVLLNLAITLLNTPTFQQAAREGANISYNTAVLVLGLQCLNFLVTVLVYFVAGVIIGRIAIQRRLGFYAGLLAGIIVYLGGFLTRYIPNYPGNLASNAPTNVGVFAGGLALSLVLLLIWGLAGGLMGLWGTWTATRKHPYYQAQQE